MLFFSNSGELAEGVSLSWYMQTKNSRSFSLVSQRIQASKHAIRLAQARHAVHVRQPGHVYVASHPAVSGPSATLPHSRSWYTNGPLRLVVYDIGNRDSWNHLEQVWREALEQTPHTLASNRLPRHVHDASVSPGMQHRALAL